MHELRRVDVASINQTHQSICQVRLSSHRILLPRSLHAENSLLDIAPCSVADALSYNRSTSPSPPASLPHTCAEDDTLIMADVLGAATDPDHEQNGLQYVVDSLDHTYLYSNFLRFIY